MNDVSKKFKRRKNKPHQWTWQQLGGGQNVRALCDYIFSGKTVEWKKFVPFDITFDMDHRILTAELKSNRKEKYKKLCENENGTTGDIISSKIKD